jgi:HK97 gp10 family phage protein
MRCEVAGVSEITAKFEALREATRGDMVSMAVRKASGVIAKEMRTLAPILDQRTAKSTAQDPGALKRSIRVSVGKPQDGVVEAWIGPNSKVAHVAYWVEMGHRLVKGGYSHVTPKGFRGPGREIGDVPQHPFLRPAFEVSVQPALAAFRDDIKALIDEVFK